MGECCDALLAADEYPSDVQLVNLIRLQSALNRVGQNFQGEALDVKVPDVPVHLYIKMIQAEIDQYKQVVASSPESESKQHRSPNNGVYLTETVYTVVAHRTSEVFLLEHAAVALKKTRQPEYEGFKMMEILYSCAQSIRSFFDAFLSMPPSNYYNVPIIYWAQAGIVLMALARITFLDHESWNKAQLSKTADGVSILDGVIDGMTRAKKEANLPENAFFDMLKKRMEMVRAWFASQSSVMNHHSSVPRTAESIINLEAQAADVNFSMIDFSAPEFWNDTSGPLFGSIDDSIWRNMFDGDFGGVSGGLNNVVI